jgi:hypothetical protein
MTLRETFEQKMGAHPGDVSAWYAKAQVIAAELAGEPGPVGLWSCGDNYLFPDGTSALVLADKIF